VVELGNAAAVGNGYVFSLSQVGGQAGVDMWDGSALATGGGDRGGAIGGATAFAGRDRAGSGGGDAVRAAAAGVRGSRATAHAGAASGCVLEARDAVLLHGYHEPVLLVLHEPEPVWVGRYR
jgi:hypothetical protein